MSATTNSVPKKRGRPKKNIELPVAPPDVTTKEQARQAVEEILSQAASSAKETMLVTPVDISGAPTTASSHDNLEQAQGDYIPGTRVPDLQQVPRRIYDEDLRTVRALGLPDDYHYCWVHTDKVTGFRINGYKFCSYNGGPGSGLAEGGFSGTGVYEKTFDNHVRNGDMFLMWCSQRQYEAAIKDDVDFSNRMETAAESEIHNDGYRRGIRTFKEVNGVTLYN